MSSSPPAARTRPLARFEADERYSSSTRVIFSRPTNKKNGENLFAFAKRKQTIGCLSLFARAQVIQAKDRAKWASRSARVDAEKRKNKAEMAEWMLVWLDDPSMFPAWVERRRAVLLNLST